MKKSMKIVSTFSAKNKKPKDMCFGLTPDSDGFVQVVGLSKEKDIAYEVLWKADKKKLIKDLGDSSVIVDSTGLGGVLAEELQNSLPHVKRFMPTKKFREEAAKNLKLKFSEIKGWHLTNAIAKKCYAERDDK